jgi:hypothetical protein
VVGRLTVLRWNMLRFLIKITSDFFAYFTDAQVEIVALKIAR